MSIKKNILSIDGGGILGLIPALVLERLERECGPVGKHVDILAGTSTGGIIAAALSVGVPASRLVELYEGRGPRIFHRSLWRRLSTLGGLTDPTYSPNALEDELRSLFGRLRLSDANTRLLVPTYDIGARAPYLVKSWRPTPDHLLREVCRATSAAPTYFPPATMDGRKLIDGGIYLNNPAFSAWAEVVKAGATIADISVLSLGTGQCTPCDYTGADDWGPIQWARPAISAAMDGSVDTADHYCGLLASEYVRINPTLPRGIAMDSADPRSIGVIRELAEQWMERNTGAIAVIKDFLTTGRASTGRPTGRGGPQAIFRGHGKTPLLDQPDVCFFIFAETWADRGCPLHFALEEMVIMALRGGDVFVTEQPGDCGQVAAAG
jgi:hypothetical protein